MRTRRNCSGFSGVETFQIKSNKVTVSTYEDMVVSNGSVGVSTLLPCTQEEADTTIFFHILNTNVSGSTRVLVRTADTDVAVIAVALFTKLNLRELWLWFGTGNKQQYIPIHSITKNQSAKSSSLPLFHALTGCHQVSFFAGRGKNRAWNTWKQYDELNNMLNYISVCPLQVNVNTALPTLEKLVVLL